MRGNNDSVTEIEGEVYIGRASFRMTPAGRVLSTEDAQVTSVLPTGPQPGAIGIGELGSETSADVQAPNVAESATDHQPAVELSTETINRAAETQPIPQTAEVAVSPTVAEPAVEMPERGTETLVAPVAANIAASESETGARGTSGPIEGTTGTVSGQIVAASFEAMTLPPEESVVLSLPHTPAPADLPPADPAPTDQLAPLPDPRMTVSKTTGGDPIAEPSRSRLRSRTLWVAAASFVAGVVVTWSMGAMRGEATRSASVTTIDKTVAPVPSTPTPAVVSNASASASPALPPGGSLTSSAGEPSGSSAEGVSVTESSAAIPAPSANRARARARLGHAAVARATPERGHRPWPPHQKTARPPGWTQPRANAAGSDGNRSTAKIDPRSVDPFDDTPAASRPAPRSTTAPRTGASGTARKSKGFVDPFGD
jgi:hypothetical protein